MHVFRQWGRINVYGLPCIFQSIRHQPYREIAANTCHINQPPSIDTLSLLCCMFFLHVLQAAKASVIMNMFIESITIFVVYLHKWCRWILCLRHRDKSDCNTSWGLWILPWFYCYLCGVCFQWSWWWSNQSEAGHSQLYRLVCDIHCFIKFFRFNHVIINIMSLDWQNLQMGVFSLSYRRRRLLNTCPQTHSQNKMALKFINATHWIHTW